MHAILASTNFMHLDSFDCIKVQKVIEPGFKHGTAPIHLGHATWSWATRPVSYIEKQRNT